jgi:hypothetical protein
VNYTGKEKLTVGADSLWDLGIGMGGREPKAGVLDTRGNYNEAMEYVKEVERFGRTSVSLPPIAFGEDEGSQRSSLTLLVRYMPLIQEVKRMRLHWGDGLSEWAKRVLYYAAMHNVEGARFTSDEINGHQIDVNWSDILPSSVEDTVNQWSVRIAGGFGTPEEAYRELGHPEPAEAAEKALKYQEEVAKKKSAGGMNVGLQRTTGEGNIQKANCPGGGNQSSKGKAGGSGKASGGKED